MHNGDGGQEWSREDRVDGAQATRSSGIGAPPSGDDRVIKVWQLLLVIFSVQAGMLGAHYSYTMSNVREMFKDHEVATIKNDIQAVSSLEEMKRRVADLEQVDRTSIAERQQLRSDVERIEKELTLIEERQAQVRAKLGLVDGVTNGGRR